MSNSDHTDAVTPRAKTTGPQKPVRTFKTQPAGIRRYIQPIAWDRAVAELAPWLSPAPRARQPRLRSADVHKIAHAVYSLACAFERLDVAMADRCLTALDAVWKLGHAPPHVHVARTRLLITRLRLLKLDDAPVMAEARQRIILKTTALAVWDGLPSAAPTRKIANHPQHAPTGTTTPDAVTRPPVICPQPRVAASRAMIPIAVPRSGLYQITVRLLDAAEPAMTMAEYAGFGALSEIASLTITSSKLSVGDPNGLAASIAVPRGRLLIRALAHGIGPVQHLTLVACRAPRSARASRRPTSLHLQP
jgi:hypothetical protein